MATLRCLNSNRMENDMMDCNDLTSEAAEEKDAGTSERRGLS